MPLVAAPVQEASFRPGSVTLAAGALSRAVVHGHDGVGPLAGWQSRVATQAPRLQFRYGTYVESVCLFVSGFLACGTVSAFVGSSHYVSAQFSEMEYHGAGNDPVAAPKIIRISVTGETRIVGIGQFPRFVGKEDTQGPRFSCPTRPEAASLSFPSVQIVDAELSSAPITPTTFSLTSTPSFSIPSRRLPRHAGDAIIRHRAAGGGRVFNLDR